MLTHRRAPFETNPTFFFGLLYALGTKYEQLVRWDPLTGTVDGIDGIDDLNKKTTASSAATPGAPGRKDQGLEGDIGAGTGDETDEGEDDLGGVLERFEWYRVLFDFSGDVPPPESAGYTEEEDPDQNLVPQVQQPYQGFRLSEAFLSYTPDL